MTRPRLAHALALAALAAAAGSILELGHAPPASASTPWSYVSPVPGSSWNLPETNVILRPGGRIDANLADAELIDVEGSASGHHAGRLHLTRDRETLTMTFDAPFTPGEVVTCRVHDGFATDRAGPLPAFEFQFTVAGPEREALRDFHLPLEELGEADDSRNGPTPSIASPGAHTAPTTGPLPDDFPVIQATTPGITSAGNLFLATFHQGNPTIPSYLLMLNNDGSPRFYRKLGALALDFKLQPNGLLTYFDTSADAFYALDSTYAVVDSFRTGNGYVTDVHDCQILPNGHVLLMSYDPQIVDMSRIIPKGNPSATVIGLIIQELDEEKNVVFQWRSWDHFQITDAEGIPLSGIRIDYVHGNSVGGTPDGNIVISSRHLNEVTKIDRATGEILWRLGGKNNQFTIVDDPFTFSFQHDARILPNGNVTLFDNGNLRPSPRFSRGVEYALDMKKMTATLVWQYRHVPDAFGPATGSVQRLPNGNTLIGWGFTTPALTEVTPDGRVAEELSFEPGVASYRALRFEWPPVIPAQVEISPRTITTNGPGGVGGAGGTGGGAITAIIESRNFDVTSIDLSSVRLQDVIPPLPANAVAGDANADGVRDLTLRFDRAALLPLLSPGTIGLSVSGALTTGERFRGYSLVQVAVPALLRGNAQSVRVLSAPGALPVVVVVGDAGAGGGAGRGLGLSIFDVQGRLVARRAALPGSLGRIEWDGRNVEGRRAPAGVYFLRLEPPPPKITTKVVIIP